MDDANYPNISSPFPLHPHTSVLGLPGETNKTTQKQPSRRQMCRQCRKSCGYIHLPLGSCLVMGQL